MMTVTHVRTARALDEPARVPFDEALQVMEQGVMDDEVGLMRWGSNYTFLVNIALESLRLMAIYKPRMGEVPLWDFPDGTLCNRETAAYLTSKALGWGLAPPTFLRDGTRGIGSVQLFIDHNPEEHYFTFDRHRFRPQLERMAIFDAIINNADRKGGHCLLDDDDHLWGIDHGLTFNASEKLRTVIWDYSGLPIPPDILADLRTLCGRLGDGGDAYTRAMAALLSRAEMRMLHWRVERLAELGVFPRPGPGRNEPWPPV
ncbi:MAG: SCO1664 family protein [Chloroflexota bacterium]|nr:SCO1664 family protein [Chloroflexota bacterium]